ncbi:hypothetical protein ABZ917_23720 [Nonomuraea wenchangensis]
MPACGVGADYQALLVSRYADKQAGSDYDRQGRAGGYGPAPTAVVALAAARLLRRARRA